MGFQHKIVASHRWLFSPFKLELQPCGLVQPWRMLRMPISQRFQLGSFRSSRRSTGNMPNSMKQCYEIQRTWPEPGTAPNIVDKVGCIMYEDEFAALENTIKDWAAGKLTGAQAWVAIQKDVLRRRKPCMIGLESMVRATSETTNCGSGHPEGFERPMFGAGVVAVETQSIFEFCENLLAGTPSTNRSKESSWIEAMKGLGVKVPKPDHSTIEACFKACVTEAMKIECSTFSWIKLVKSCLCFEVARHVKPPKDGLPLSAMEESPEAAKGTLLAPLLGKPQHLHEQ